MSKPTRIEMLEMFHNEIREMNDEVCAYFNDEGIDAQSSYLITQRLCEAAFWTHQLYHATIEEAKKNEPITPPEKPLKIVKDKKDE